MNRSVTWLVAGLVLAGAGFMSAAAPSASVAAKASTSSSLKASPAVPPSATHTRKVAIVVYQGVEILDFAGPAEVFAAAAGFGATGGTPAFEVFTVARTRDPIVSQGFIDVIPDHGIADCPRPDVVVFPGGNSRSVMDDAEWMAWVRTVTGEAEHVLTVCTGAFIVGGVGMLDGHDVTTWYNAVPRLAEQFPKARVIPGRRFIDNGKLITTAGVSAGIDGSLHLVARLEGRYVADRVAEYMEYKWSPESYLSAHYPLLAPDLDARGQSLQLASIQLRDNDLEGAAATYRALTQANPADAEAWLGLGTALHMAKRYDDAIAANLQARKGEAQRRRANYNLACEYSLTGRKHQAIAALEESVKSGMRQRGVIESDADLAALRGDPRYQKLIAGLN